jgi:hypothetical protein
MHTSFAACGLRFALRLALAAATKRIRVLLDAGGLLVCGTTKNEKRACRDDRRRWAQSCVHSAGRRQHPALLLLPCVPARTRNMAHPGGAARAGAAAAPRRRRTLPFAPRALLLSVAYALAAALLLRPAAAIDAKCSACNVVAVRGRPAAVQLLHARLSWRSVHVGTGKVFRCAPARSRSA